MLVPKISRKSRFRIRTQNALCAERKGDFELATKEWWGAFQHAPSQEEMQYCAKRAETCEKRSQF